MSEPATKEDIEALRLDVASLESRVEAARISVDNMRAQNSAEHGSLFTKLLHITDLMHWLRDKWDRFMGPPAPGAKLPKDDTQ